MSVLAIRNMEMPKSCSVCPLCQEQSSDICGQTGDKVEDLYSKRNANCPLVVLSPHDKLLDAYALEKKLFSLMYDPQINRLSQEDVVDDIIDMVHNAPTILEASKED